jgi:hypothetical protein
LDHLLVALDLHVLVALVALGLHDHIVAFVHAWKEVGSWVSLIVYFGLAWDLVDCHPLNLEMAPSGVLVKMMLELQEMG